jgi:uncharacterized protein YndB with AHSA1/START domain
MTEPTVSHDTFVIERVYEVPADRVFRAWAEPERKARWFAGSVEALDAGYELDFRVGGREVNRGGPPDGPVYTYDARFNDIVPGRRIVYTYEMYAGDDRISVSVATIEFRGEASATRLVLTEQGVFLGGLDTVAQRQEGSRAFLETLGAHLGDDGA